MLQLGLGRFVNGAKCLHTLSLGVRNRLLCYKSESAARYPAFNVTISNNNKNINCVLLIRRELSFLRYLRRVQNFSSSRTMDSITEGEGRLKKTITACFPKATKIIVEDISGGCGSMYQIFIESPDFKGLSIVKQHQLVNQALKQEIRTMHGIRIQTAVSKDEK